MFELCLIVFGVVIGAGWCLHRLRGEETVTEALMRVVPFSGGGPRPRVPR